MCEWFDVVEQKVQRPRTKEERIQFARERLAGACYSGKAQQDGNVFRGFPYTMQFTFAGEGIEGELTFDKLAPAAWEKLAGKNPLSVRGQIVDVLNWSDLGIDRVAVIVQYQLDSRPRREKEPEAFVEIPIGTQQSKVYFRDVPGEIASDQRITGSAWLRSDRSFDRCCELHGKSAT